MEPVSLLLALFGPFLAAGKLAYKAHENKIQTKNKCTGLVERVKDLVAILQKYPDDVAIDKDQRTTTTARVQLRLKDALDEALKLIDGCQGGGVFSGKYCGRKVREFDNVDRKITNCILSLILEVALGHAARSVLVVHHVLHDYSSNYNRARGAVPSSSVLIPASFSVVSRLPDGSSQKLRTELCLPHSFHRWLGVGHHAELNDPHVQTPVVRRTRSSRPIGGTSGGGAPVYAGASSTKPVHDAYPPFIAGRRRGLSGSASRSTP